MSKSKEIKLIILLLLTIIFSACCFFLGNQKSIDSKALSVEKTYCYEIIKDGGGYIVKGANNDESFYQSLPLNYTDIITYIENDMTGANANAVATIDFGVLNVGNESLTFDSGNYTLMGQIEAVTQNPNGVVYIKDANVNFQNLQLKNLGSANLIKMDGDGDLEVNGGEYTSSSVCLMNLGDGDITINSGNFVSTKASTIMLAGNDSSILSIKQAPNKLTTFEGNDATYGAIYSLNSVVEIGGGGFKNSTDCIIKIEQNAKLYIYNEINFNAVEMPIVTYSTIYASNVDGNKFYTGETIKIDFKSALLDWQTIVVANVVDGNANKFVVNSARMKLKQFHTQLKSCLTYRLSYNANGRVINNLPENDNEYFKEDTVHLEFLATDVVEHYRFVGYNTDKNAETPLFTIGGNEYATFPSKNLVLYAIFEAIEYTINYDLSLDGVTNNNVTKYTILDCPIRLSYPTLRFHEFIGWTGANCTIPVKNVVISASYNNIGDVSLIANWDYMEYNINYVGLTNEQASDLGLKTTYTINDDNYKFTVDNIRVPGYSVYGLYFDELHTIAVDDVIAFAPNNTSNPTYFNTAELIGKELNFYVEMGAFQNSLGLGTQINPYQISNTQELIHFVLGEKIDGQGYTYVKLVNDIEFAYTNGVKCASKLVGYNFNGNGKTITINSINADKDLNMYALFTNVEKCNFENVNILISNKMPLKVKEGNYSPFVGLAVNSNFNNIVVQGSVIVEAGYNESASYSVASVVNTVKNSEKGHYIANCRNEANISFNMSGDKELQASVAGIVVNASNVAILNCANLEDITFKEKKDNSNFYTSWRSVAGIAVVQNNGQIYNCYNKGEIKVVDSYDEWTFASGIAITQKENNIISNCINFGDVGIENQENLNKSYANEISIVNIYDNVKVNNNFAQSQNWFVVWDTANGCYRNRYNDYVIVPKNWNSINVGVISSLNNNSVIIVEKLSSEYNINVPLNKWYLNANTLIPQFDETIVVTFDYAGFGNDKQIVIEKGSKIDAKYAYYYKKVFEGWFADISLTKAFDFEQNINKNITIYSSWSKASDHLLPLKTEISIICLIIILVLAILIILVEIPKKVRFVLNNNNYATKKYRYGQKIQCLINGKEVAWYLDANAKLNYKRMKMLPIPMKLHTWGAEELVALKKAQIEEQEEIERQKAKKLINKEKKKQEVALRKVEQAKLRAETKQRQKEEMEAFKILAKQKLSESYKKREMEMETEKQKKKEDKNLKQEKLKQAKKILKQEQANKKLEKREKLEAKKSKIKEKVENKKAEKEKNLELKKQEAERIKSKKLADAKLKLEKISKEKVETLPRTDLLANNENTSNEERVEKKQAKKILFDEEDDY